MKIALINSAPFNTGVGKYVYNLFKHLSNSDDVSYFYTGYNPYGKEVENINVIKPKFKLPFLRQSLNDFFYYCKNIPKNYDIYHIASQGMGVYLKHIKKPTIITVHDLIPLFFPENNNFILNYFARKSINYIKKANLILADSYYTKKNILELYNIDESKIKVLYLGIDHTIFKQLKSIKKENIILNVGSEEKRKNISTLIKAFYLFQKKFSKFKFIRVGPKSKQIAQLIKKLNLEDKVIYKQNLSEQELAQLYNKSKLFIFPSVYEGFGYPLVEAMACGCLTLILNRTSLPEISNDSSFIFSDPYNPKELSNQMELAIKDEKLMEKLIKKGLDNAKIFSWDNYIKDYKKAIKELIK